MLDWLVIGSGFGGSVSALRLAEKGYAVEVLEQGERFEDSDFPRSAWQLRRYLWNPRLGMRGILRMQPFKHVSVIAGVGVGGGSLVYANTLYVPHSDDFYRHPQWRELADWRAELAPHYETAERMLGVVDYAGDGPSERVMQAVADDLGVGASARPTRVGVFFGPPEERVPDPYFGGAGPDRVGCNRCGECLVGCRVGAKNTLTKNYLWFAERLGVRVRPGREVTDIRPAGAADGSDGYLVTSRRAGAWLRRDERQHRARGVVVAAGALGTNELLASCRRAGALPRLSARVGHLVRTNSEAITAATSERPGADYASGVAITRSLYPDSETHVTNNTYGRAGDAVALTFGPLTDGTRRLPRPLQLVASVLRHPLRTLRRGNPRGWSRRTIVFTTMQSADNAIRLRTRRRGRRLQSEMDPERPIRADLPIANRVAELAAKHMDGFPQSAVFESLLGTPTTAHILGGAVIGSSPADGVVDRHRRAFGYENLLVCDGASVPANPGVNPSLTITAMAEEAMSHIGPAPKPPSPPRDIS